MKNRSTALSLTVALTCVFSMPAESQSFEPFALKYTEASVAYANPACSTGSTEMLSLQPDGNITVTDFVVAEPAKKEAEPNPIFVKEATTETVAVSVPMTVPMAAAVVPVSTPQYQPQPQVYSVPTPTYYPAVQPQTRVCTSGG